MINFKTTCGWWVKNLHGGQLVSFVSTSEKERRGGIAKFPKENAAETAKLIKELSGLKVEAQPIERRE